MGSSVAKESQPSGLVSQWVNKVKGFSSQYDNKSWPASCVIGSPKVYPKYGDIAGAWAPRIKDNKQFLELGFKESIYINGIDIYETYHCGGVTAVKALDQQGSWQTLWEADSPENLSTSRIFSPPLSSSEWKTNTIRIEVDCTACGSWVEIDAVKLHGYRDKSAIQSVPSSGVVSQWVNKVKGFSSQYDSDRWSASCVIGSPKVYPKYGDIAGAWAPKIKDNKQFLELGFKESIYITGIDIYETYHCGGVTAVKALDQQGSWQTLWEAYSPENLSTSRIFSPPLSSSEWKTNTIRIEVDCTACGSWVEIDAVKLHGYRDKSAIQSVPSSGVVSQWVNKVKGFSSQYDSDRWSASCVIGSPKVYPKYGDIAGAWAPKIKDNKQFLELGFKESIYITGIDIYETYHCGGVTAVKALDQQGSWQTLWEAYSPENLSTSRIFSPPLSSSGWKTNTICIEIDCTACGSWVEIDAVKLHGYRDTSAIQSVPSSGVIFSQWVNKVRGFSSQYDSDSWPATCVIGSPKVFPRYGDLAGAWAPGIIDSEQFLELEYKESVYITGIDIYETYHCGGVTAVKALDQQGSWQTLWRAKKPENIGKSRLFSPPLTGFEWKTNVIRIEVDCTACGTWVEIDAVKLHGYREQSGVGEAVCNRTMTGEIKSQWVSKVTKYSSQYNDGGWSANSVTGSPNVYPDYGDKSGVWAPKDLDWRQFIEVEFEDSVYVCGIDIYETFHAGGVTHILGLDVQGKWQTLWKTDKPEVIKSSRIFSLPLSHQALNGKTRNIRVEVDCTAANSWVEIDAIKLHGRSETVESSRATPTAPSIESDALSQWVKIVTKYSSQYDDLGWPADSVKGVPEVYPNYGDINGAWAPSETCINDSQFLELEYHEPVYVTAIDIYETFNAGGVVAIKGLDGRGIWQTLWRTDKPTCIQTSRVFSPQLNLQALNCETKNIRIEVNCMAANDYVEIDAVQLHGHRYPTEPPPPYSEVSAMILTQATSDQNRPIINDKMTSDCQFLLGGKDTVYAHKDVLCDKSDYFRQMFSDDSKMSVSVDPNRKIVKEISDISYVSFMGVLHYLYKFKFPEEYTCIMLTDVWRAGDKLKIEDLKTLVEEKIRESVDEHNAIEVYLAATKTSPVIERVKDYCEQYMTSNMKKIVNSPNFTSLPFYIMPYPY